MKNFENKIKEIQEEALQKRQNIEMKTLALINIYNNLTDEQKNELDELFIIASNN